MRVSVSYQLCCSFDFRLGLLRFDWINTNDIIVTKNGNNSWIKVTLFKAITDLWLGWEWGVTLGLKSIMQFNPLLAGEGSACGFKYPLRSTNVAVGLLTFLTFSILSESFKQILTLPASTPKLKSKKARKSVFHVTYGSLITRLLDLGSGIGD